MSATQHIRIKVSVLSDAEYETGCSILNTSVKRLFTLPGIQEEYEEWLKTEEGQKADLPKNERRSYVIGKRTSRT